MDDNYANIPERRFARFGDRLGRALDAKGLTPADVSGHLRISTQMVGKYLRGESLPSPQRLRELSGLVGIPVEQLLEGVDIQRRPRTPQAMRLIQNERSENSRQAHPTRIIPDDSLPRRAIGYITHYNTPEGNGPREREPRPIEIVVDYLTEWAERELPGIRNGATVPQVQPNLKGPYFSYRPDWCILGDTEPLLGVEIKSVMWSDTLPALAGIAECWKRATNAAPFFLVLLNLREPSRPVSPSTIDAIERMRNNKLIEGYQVINSTGLDTTPIKDLDALCRKIEEALLLR